MKLVKAYDEKMKTLASGVDIRPITETEIRCESCRGEEEWEHCASAVVVVSDGSDRVVAA